MLKGKIGVIIGAANKHSIAWGVAQSWVTQGMRVHLFCQSERFVSGLNKLASSSTSNQDGGSIAGVHICDISDDVSISRAVEKLKSSDEFLNSGHAVNAVLHAVAHAPATAMKNPLIETSRNDFLSTHDVSSYSLIGVSRELLPLMFDGGSITALSYLGSTKVVPSYNVMGCAKASLEAVARGLAVELGPSPHNIRVNCINPGPISSLASRGIKGFVEMKSNTVEKTPMGRTATSLEVGDMAAFLASDSGNAISGQVIYMDGGISGMAP